MKRLYLPGFAKDQYHIDVWFSFDENQTTCYIEEYAPKIYPEKTRRFIGVSKCHPDDEYDKSIGVTIAFGRATAKRMVVLEKMAQQTVKMVNNLFTLSSAIATKRIEKKFDYDFFDANRRVFEILVTGEPNEN